MIQALTAEATPAKGPAAAGGAEEALQRVGAALAEVAAATAAGGDATPTGAPSASGAGGKRERSPPGPLKISPNPAPQKKQVVTPRGDDPTPAGKADTPN